VVIVGLVQDNRLSHRHLAAEEQPTAKGFVLVNFAGPAIPVTEDALGMANTCIVAVRQEVVLTEAIEGGFYGRYHEAGYRFNMRSKELGDQIFPEKLFAINVEAVGQGIDLVRQEYTGKRAALSAIITGIKITLDIKVHAFSRRLPFFNQK
jgi:hypothetical protein